MVRHPIRIARNGYKGANAKKQANMMDENRIASDLETKINDLLLKQTAPIQSYTWSGVANATGYSFETIKRLGYSIDCGSNGFTAWRYDLTYEEAMTAST